MTRRGEPIVRPAPPSILWLIVAGFVTAILVLFAVTRSEAPLVLLPLIVSVLMLIPWIVAAVGFGLVILRMFRLELDAAARSACHPSRGTAQDDKREHYNDRTQAALENVIATSLGLGFLSLLTLILGCFGVLNRATSIATIVIGCALTLIHLRKTSAVRWDRFRKPAHWNWLFLALIPLLTLVLSCAMLPPGILWGDEPNGYDVTEYHLQVPREWYQAHKIIPLHHNVFSYFPFNVEMHYLLAMHLMGGPWKGMYLSQLMHAAFIVLTVIAIWALLVEKHPRGAIIAAVIAGATPWLALLVPIAYDEGGLLLFGTLAIGLTIGALDEPRSTRWMLLAGAFAGLACGSKLTAVPMILIPVPVIYVLICLGRRKLRRQFSNRPFQISKAFLAFCVAAAVTFSPWLIRDVIWTGNPVFPELTSVFGKAHWSEQQVQRWKRANHQPRADQQNLPGRARALWDQILADPRYAFILLPLGVFAALLRRDRASLFLLSLLIVQATFWLFFTHLQSRFFVLSIPISALLIGGVRFRGYEIVGAILALLVATFGTFDVTLKTAGMERRLAQYQIRLFQLAGMPSLRNLSRLPETDDGKTVELVGEGQAFLYDIPMSRLYYRTVFDVDAKPGQSAEQAWRNGWPGDGPKVLVIRNEGELERFHRTYYGIP